MSRAHLLHLLRISLIVRVYALNASLGAVEGPPVCVSRSGWEGDVQRRV